jgi:hypothetical protein
MVVLFLRQRLFLSYFGLCGGWGQPSLINRLSPLLVTTIMSNVVKLILQMLDDRYGIYWCPQSLRQLRDHLLKSTIRCGINQRAIDRRAVFTAQNNH